MGNLNEEILDELIIFNKDRNLSRLERKQKELEKQLGEYKPVKLGDPMTSDAMFTTDPDAIKKRLMGGLGVVMGNNTIKSMADKAVKRFPIIMSDDISPETAVMLKSFLEEQYCNDVCLLVSNMSIDISRFKKNNSDGNIAIQAMELITNTEFNNKNIARKALNGTLTSNDLFRNSPVNALLRTESFGEAGYTTGDESLDSLLSEAIVMPSYAVNDYINIVSENAKNIALDENMTDINNTINTLYDKNMTATSIYYGIDSIIKTNRPDIDKYIGPSDVFKIINTYINNMSKVSKIDIARLKTIVNDTLGIEEFNVENIAKTFDKNPNKITNVNNMLYVLDAIYKHVKHKDSDTHKEKESYMYGISNNVDNYSDYKRTQLAKQSTINLGLDSESNKIANKYLSQIFNPIRTQKGMSIRPDSNGRYRSVDDMNNSNEIQLQTLADVLALPENYIIRDRFNKAIYLLGSSRISGSEFNAYCSSRLGLPLGAGLRGELENKYPVKEVVFDGISADETNMRNKLTDTISKQDNITFNPDVYRIANDILKNDWKRVLKYSGLGAITFTTAAIPAAIAVAPWALAIGATGGAVAGLITLLVRSRRKNKQIPISNRISGWERVEALINAMDANFKTIQSKYGDVVNYRTRINNPDSDIKIDSKYVPQKSEVDMYKKFCNNMNNIYNQHLSYKPSKLNESLDLGLDESYSSSDIELLVSPTVFHSLFEAIVDNSKNDKLADKIDIDIYNERIDTITRVFDKYPAIREAMTIITDKPTDNKRNKKATEIKISNKTPISYQTYDIQYKNKNLEPLIVPDFTAADMRAYGSVEFDRKVIRDRRYNEPLFITVKFKTRYADDKFKDSELTAVIGILGVVTQVPSEEMTSILMSNAGIDGANPITMSTDGVDKSALSTLFDIIAGPTHKLEKSGKVWDNLSKVTRLALANKLGGKSSNELSNAHLIFSTRETQKVKVDGNVDYLRNVKLAEKLMKKYNASEVLVCDDLTERAYICDDLDKISYDVVPYSALRSKSSSDQTLAALNSIAKQRM